jgi:hypothetical protein
MQEGKKHRTYDRQFKEEAIRLVTESGRSVSDVARGLGIHENLLQPWDIVPLFPLRWMLWQPNVTQCPKNRGKITLNPLYHEFRQFHQ